MKKNSPLVTSTLPYQALLSLAFPNQFPKPSEKELIEAQMLVYKLAEAHYTHMLDNLKLPTLQSLLAKYDALESEEEQEEFLDNDGRPLAIAEELMAIDEESQKPKRVKIKLKDLYDEEFGIKNITARWVIAVLAHRRTKRIYYLWNRKGKQIVKEYEMNGSMEEVIQKLDPTNKYLVSVQSGIPVNVAFYRLTTSAKKLEIVKKFDKQAIGEIKIGKVIENGQTALQRFQIGRSQYLYELVLHKKILGYMEDLGL